MMQTPLTMWPGHGCTVDVVVVVVGATVVVVSGTVVVVTGTDVVASGSDVVDPSGRDVVVGAGRQSGTLDR
jgi:hypothetical protein